MQKKQKKAFTLIEILLAMMIASIIVLAVHGAYKQGGIAWHRSEVDALAYHQMKGLAETLRTEIGSMYIQAPTEQQGGPEPDEDEKPDEIFILTNSQLSFYTLNPSHNTSARYSRISKVSYIVESNEETNLKTIKRMETLAAGAKTLEIPPVNAAMIDIVSGIRFEAYVKDPETEEYSWKGNYKSNESLPKAIAININKPATKYTKSYNTRLIITIGAGN